MKYKVNNPYVVYDAMEGEVVIVNLRLGFYYSVRGIGADIWESLVQGYSQKEIVEKLLGDYDADRQSIEKSVADMLELFTKEQFLTPLTEKESAQVKEITHHPRPVKLKFASPNFEKFTDTKDVLLLDPVHDVDENGWPNQPNNP
jgi:hypothetical protein